jgi:hypothetical protein
LDCLFADPMVWYKNDMNRKLARICWLGGMTGVLLLPGLRGMESASPAPNLELATVQLQDLGLWDDAFCLPDGDAVVVRRGDGFYSLSFTNPVSPVQLATVEGVAGSRIVAAVATGSRFWVFLQLPTHDPVAVDLSRGMTVTFNTPIPRLPWKTGPQIQSHVLIPQADAALLMVSGGEGRLWPRRGNYPYFFHLGLASGKVTRFDSDWSLEYFSADLTTAYFATPGRPCAKVDMRTAAKLGTGFPNDADDQPFISFHWTDTQAMQPLYVRPRKGGGFDHLYGIVVDGRPRRIACETIKPTRLEAAAVADDLVAFILRGDGEYNGTPKTLWINHLDTGGALEQVATNVTSFALLRGGVCVVVTPDPGGARSHSEASFCPRGSPRWNVLDGVERLPVLDPALANKDYVEDSFRIDLVPGGGGFGPIRAVLCVATHTRHDMRSMPFSLSSCVPTQLWRRVLVVTDTGNRQMTPLFREGAFPDMIWFHHGGTALAGSYYWEPNDSKSRRRVGLKAYHLSLCPP